MFGNEERDEKIKKLREELDALRKRVFILEADCAPFRIGEVRYSAFYLSNDLEDSRPRISLHETARRLMAHCGLRFEKTPVTGGDIVVKDKKDDVLFIQSGDGTTATTMVGMGAPKKTNAKRKRHN